MVGGKVIGLTRKPGGWTRVNVQGTGCESRDTCNVKCIDPKCSIKLDDEIWWQGGYVYLRDLVFKKLGYSV